MDRRGIALVDLAASGYETPLTTVLVNTTAATRTIVNPPFVQPELRALDGAWDTAWGDRPAVALTDGFHLGETLPLLKALRDRGTAMCLDGGSWKIGTDLLAPFLTAAICSERFVAPDGAATLEWFAEQGVPHVAVTRGARPILGLDRGRQFEIAIEPVEALDTLGAGDVLHGAFCFYFAQSGDFEGALRWAAETASRSCEGLGIAHWAAN
jgi:hypothetical protein